MSTPVATTSTSKAHDDSKAMPPPPLPENKTVSSKPKILQPEFEALATCLRDAIIKTGQVYRFHAEARRLGLANQVVTPPSALTAGLGRDIERYDQLCDSIEAQIVRAINVLKRDLRREERRLEDEERLKLAEASKLPPAEPMQEDVKAPSEADTVTPTLSPTVSTTVLGRRPSAISISSLHRPQIPLKLDLSSSALKITEEEAMKFQKGLASPVTLAPKSARPVGPNEFPPDFMSSFGTGPIGSDIGSTTIDLTIPEGSHLPQDHSHLGLRMGDSSDKPIELDLENMDVEMGNMSDLFGDTAESSEGNNDTDGLFSPPPTAGPVDQSQKDQQNLVTDFNMESNVSGELFSDFTSNTQPSTSGDGGAARSLDPSAPLPGTLLAQLSSVDVKPSSTAGGGGEGFDLTTIDLTNLDSEFFNSSQNSGMNFSMDMDQFMSMDSETIVKKEEDA